MLLQLTPGRVGGSGLYSRGRRAGAVFFVEEQKKQTRGFGRAQPPGEGRSVGAVPRETECGSFRSFCSERGRHCAGGPRPPEQRRAGPGPGAAAGPARVRGRLFGIRGTCLSQGRPRPEVAEKQDFRGSRFPFGTKHRSLRPMGDASARNESDWVAGIVLTDDVVVSPEPSSIPGVRPAKHHATRPLSCAAKPFGPRRESRPAIPQVGSLGRPPGEHTTIPASPLKTTRDAQGPWLTRAYKGQARSRRLHRGPRVVAGRSSRLRHDQRGLDRPFIRASTYTNKRQSMRLLCLPFTFFLRFFCPFEINNTCIVGAVTRPGHGTAAVTRPAVINDRWPDHRQA